MAWVLCIAGAGAGLALGWEAAARQHLLYRQEEYREHPATGRKLRIMRVWLALAAGAVGGLAFRPDHYDFWPALLTAVFGFVLLLLASTDFDRRIIPNNLSYPAIVSALAASWAWPDRDVPDILIGAGFALAVAAGLFVFGQVFGMILGVRATPFGMGDVKLIILLGLLLGWPAIMYALFLGVVIAGIPGLVLTFAGRGRGVFAYGPYLAFGGLVALLWPERFV